MQIPHRINDSSSQSSSAELLEDIIPLVEKNYRVLSELGNLAIAGLSMGGGKAFFTGLTHPDRFAWVAEFSSATVGGENLEVSAAIPGFIENPSITNEHLRLLFLWCDFEDNRHAGHQRVVETLKQRDIHHDWLSLPGGFHRQSFLTEKPRTENFPHLSSLAIVSIRRLNG